MSTSIILCYSISIKAQREFGVCDSTFHFFNMDTTIVVGKSKIYISSNNSLTNLADFSSSNENEYIRDFDIATTNIWFTVVGNKNIGGESRLYKSVNKGQSWLLDTAHFHASNATSISPSILKSINNLLHLSGDTLMLFNGYYHSAVLYSTNLGQTWTKWFDNLITHYQGMFTCNDQYYIYGFPGDAFRASMFSFQKDLLFSTDSTNLWNHFNSTSYHPQCYNSADTINCIYPIGNNSRCAIYHFFKDTITSLCNTLTENQEILMTNKHLIYPNPFYDKINILNSSPNMTFSLTNLLGEITWSGKNIDKQDFSLLPKGIYILTVFEGNKINKEKLIKE